ncbi:MAG: hypothetical protein R2774_11705 [Saprospiraceae bacterium]
MTIVKIPIALISTFLWIGFVCVICFMEAYLKFHAPGITLPLGLDVGRVVFNALNSVEWVFEMVIFISIVWNSAEVLDWQSIFFVVLLILLLIQTFWLLPALDIRAELYISGQIAPASNLQFYYLGMEIVKVASLTIFGLKKFKNTTI